MTDFEILLKLTKPSPTLTMKQVMLYRPGDSLFRPDCISSLVQYYRGKDSSLMFSQAGSDTTIPQLFQSSLFGSTFFVIDSRADDHLSQLVSTFLSKLGTVPSIPNRVLIVSDTEYDLSPELKKVVSFIDPVQPTKTNTSQIAEYFLRDFPHALKSSNLSQFLTIVTEWVASDKPDVLQIKSLVELSSLEYYDPAQANINLSGVQQYIQSQTSSVQYHSLTETLSKFLLNPTDQNRNQVLTFLNDFRDPFSVKSLLSTIYGSLLELTYSSQEVNPSQEFPPSYKPYRITQLQALQVPALSLLRFMNILSKYEPDLSVSSSPIQTLAEVLSRYLP